MDNSVAAKRHHFHVSLGTESLMSSEQLHLLGEKVEEGDGVSSASKSKYFELKMCGDAVPTQTFSYFVTEQLEYYTHARNTCKHTQICTHA